MRRSDVAHILRAARALTNEREFVVGSQAAHAGIAELPDAMQQSGELDLYPLRRPELADVIEGAIGEGSQFHETFGYYAQAVAPETAKLPSNWRQRSLRIASPETEGAIGIAPEIHDICASKLVAMREKDFEFAQAAIDAGLVMPEVLLERLAEIEGLPQVIRDRAAAWVAARVGDRPRR